MELTVQNVYGLLLRSKLLPLDQARTMYDRWNAEARDAAGNLLAFTRWVVAHRYLTEYQAGLLARGHADGFFLNQYKILDRLGKGRMAGVYKAAHELGQVVAIKVLPPSKARDPQFLARFQREARLAFKLKHPNIVRAFQVGQAAGLHFFVMEYLEGEMLDEVLRRRGKLPPPEAVRLVHQAMSGLQHIHTLGLVHRDLKPANLMLVPPPPPGANETTQRCTVKILDIGLGRAMFEDVPADKKSNPGLTSEGVLLGTPDYMAPEQARDARSVDIRSDIYSLGCVLYHALAGQPPFPDTNIINQMIRHATEAPRPLKELNPAVPDGLQQIVNWMLAKDPKERYATPERAAQALQVFLVAGAEVPTALEADPKMKPFLSWVEAENSKVDMAKPRAGGLPRPTHPRPSAVPVPQPRPATPVVTPAKPPAGAAPPTPVVARPAVPTAPQASAVTPANPAAVKKETVRTKSSGKAGKRRSKKNKRRTGANPVAIPVNPGEAGKAPALEFDVELVPLPAPGSPAAQASSPWQLTLRDCVLFGAGVGGTLLAIFVALVLSFAFPRKNHEPTPPETPMTAPE
jgi:eukaryotic-like serine/threonine-protein kinase